MLRITLYKKCILNETYQNVISTGNKNGKSVLERYLETLDSYPIDDLEDVYYENSGTLNFDLELINQDDIYEYNYMKIRYYDEEESLLLIRYCFIYNISIKNEIVYLSYKEDIFSSYSNSIEKIQESYLSKSRIVAYSNKNISPYLLPMNYDGNKPPIIESLLTINTNTQYYLLAEIQMYNLESEGVYTKRTVKYLKLNNRSDTHGISRVSVDEFIIKAVENMSKGFIREHLETTPNTDNYYSYEIGDIYLFPCSLINSDIGQSGTYLYSFVKDTDNTGEFGVCREILGVPNLTLKKTITLNNNFKNLLIGTLDKFTEIINNGLNNEIKIYYSKNDYNIALQMGFQNQLIDITESYKLDVPVKSLLSEELSQLRIARELKNKNLDYERRTTITNGLMDLWKRGNNVFKGFMIGGGYGALASGIQESPGTTGTILNSSFKLQNIADNRKAVNAKAYCSNNGIFGNSSNMVNQTLGLIVLKIDSINDDYVKSSINNFGYETFEFIKDLSEIDFKNVDFYINNNINYNSLKFESINVIGSFTNEIAIKLNEILLSGIKIWYNENLQDDNLVVG